MRKIGAAYIAASLALSGHAYAGPDAVANWLMDDAASMLDIGLLRIENAINSNTLPDPVGGFTSYDWDSNRIVVFVDFYFPEGDGEKMCAKWVDKVRKVAMVYDGKPFSGDQSAFSRMFEHRGFGRHGGPADWDKSVDKMIELHCRTTGEIAVKAPLLGTTYSLEKAAEN